MRGEKLTLQIHGFGNYSHGEIGKFMDLKITHVGKSGNSWILKLLTWENLEIHGSENYSRGKICKFMDLKIAHVEQLGFESDARGNIWI